MPDSILANLRQETGAMHAALEDCVDIEQRAQDLGSYRTLLEQFHGYYAPLEASLLEMTGWPTSYDPAHRLKTPWLTADLKALGCDPATIAALPQCAQFPRLPDLSTAFGVAYVLEGATLGGRMITGILSRGPVPMGARQFFASYGAATGPMWKSFCESLETFASKSGDCDQIVAGAKATFSSMENWICSREVLT